MAITSIISNTTLSGTTRSSDGTVIVPNATVYLYRKDTGALVDSTSSANNGTFSFSVSAGDPTTYYAVGDTDAYLAGVVDVEVAYDSIAYTLVGILVDPDTDFLIVPVPNPTKLTLVRVEIWSMLDTTVAGTIHVRNSSGGGGSSLDVSVTSGTNEWSEDGSLSITNYLYVRTGAAGDVPDLNNATVSLIFEYPGFVGPLPSSVH